MLGNGSRKYNTRSSSNTSADIPEIPSISDWPLNVTYAGPSANIDLEVGALPLPYHNDTDQLVGSPQRDYSPAVDPMDSLLSQLSSVQVSLPSRRPPNVRRGKSKRYSPYSRQGPTTTTAQAASRNASPNSFIDAINEHIERLFAVNDSTNSMAASFADLGVENSSASSSASSVVDDGETTNSSEEPLGKCNDTPAKRTRSKGKRR